MGHLSGLATRPSGPRVFEERGSPRSMQLVAQTCFPRSAALCCYLGTNRGTTKQVRAASRVQCNLSEFAVTGGDSYVTRAYLGTLILRPAPSVISRGISRHSASSVKLPASQRRKSSMSRSRRSAGHCAATQRASGVKLVFVINRPTASGCRDSAPEKSRTAAGPVAIVESRWCLTCAAPRNGKPLLGLILFT
jgi:hypothetical protein